MSPRLAATRVLLALERGRTTLSAEVDRDRTELTDPRDRGLFLEIAVGAVRWRAEIDACIAARSALPFDSLGAEVRATLRVAAYQLLHLDRVPAHAVVNDSVEVVRALGQPRAASFVNAVLRGLLRGNARKDLPARPVDPTDSESALGYLSVTLSHPRWLVARWLEREGFDAVERWCRFNNTAPSVTVRDSSVSGDVAELAHAIAAEGFEAVPARFVPNALTLPAGTLGRLSEPVRAKLAIHDEGSLVVAHAAGATDRERVLDVCAAPGGKTTILCERVGSNGLVIAGDQRPARVSLLRASLHRAGANALVIALDARRALPFSAVFDRVLLDVPCTGLGTLRRDPDIKWTRTPADLPQAAAVQRQMIAHAADVVRPGGSLIYATCSSEPEENDDVVTWFLGSRPDFARQPITFDDGMPEARSLIDARGALGTKPFRDELDAFFAARLVRHESA